MRALITGGAGFLGSHLADALVADGHEVIIIDDLSTGRRANIRHLLDEDAVKFHHQDVLDLVSVSGDLDYVLHLASRASPPDYQGSPIHTLRTNSEGTLNMVELAADHDAKFLYTSTSEIYGDPEVHPQPESYNGNVSTTGPRACYDEGKRFGEAVVTSYAREHGLDWRIVRIFNTYGPRMRPDDGRVISNFLVQALNGDPITVYGYGSQTRSFCYVDDLMRGIRAVMDADSGTLTNLGNPDEISILELAETVQAAVDTDSEIVHQELPEDDPSKRKPDISRARRELDWEPEVPLRDGLRDTADHFRGEV